MLLSAVFDFVTGDVFVTIAVLVLSLAFSLALFKIKVYFLLKYVEQIPDAFEVRCAPSTNSTSNLTLLEMKDQDICPKNEKVYLKVYLEEKKCVFISMIAVLSVLVFALSIWLYYIKNENFVKAVLFTHCPCMFRLPGCQKVDEKDKTFDCFISYGSEDVDVPLAIVSAMGEDPNPEFQFCVHDRHWTGGSSISDNIFRSVELSRKMLIVISQTFVKNRWFYLEFQAALMQMLKDRRDRMIFVIKGELPENENLPRDVRHFLRTRTYLVWGERWFMEKLRYPLQKESVPLRVQLLEFLFVVLNCFRNKRLYHRDQPEEIVLAVRWHLPRKEKIKKILDLNNKDLTPEDLGLIPSRKEYELESPCNNMATHSDGIHFVGISSDNNVIDICINRIGEEMASVWVILQLSDGTVYRLPCNDSRKPYIANGSTFSNSGLQIKCLSPLRRWRISFNGILRKYDGNTREQDELIHTKFSFVWLAMSSPQEQNISYTKKELARAFTDANRAIREKDLQWLHMVQNRYEQWGQMMGTIAFKGEEVKEFYFWSMKTRIADSPPWDEKMCSAKFYMYFPDGVPMKVETISIKDFVTNLTSGYTISPCGGVKPIAECDFISHLVQEKNKKIECSFRLNGEKKTVHATFCGVDVTLFTGDELQHEVIMLPFKAQVSGFDDGYGILHFSQSSSTEQRKLFHPPPMLLKDPGYSTCEKLVLLLEDDLCSSSLLSGGKGSSLALLTKLSKRTNQFVVPKGFVITTKAFEDHIRSNKAVADAISKLKDISCRKLPGDLKKECDKCTKAFTSSELSEHLKNEIKRILQENCQSLQNVRFSVRSSAFGEDSEDLSAAGQMLTILGVKGVDKVFRAVIECWSSKFGFEAVQYSRQNGQSLMSPMAVVVQEMVPSDFSGVLFTVDPVTGNPIYPYITANFGLGETVVSALADPDTVILKRCQDQSLQVFKTNIGSKKTQVFMTAGDGVERKDYENHSQLACLRNEWAIKIGNAGILIETCFCSPRDIEWAVHNDQLYLLQARPITTLHAETDFELIHDQDTPTRSTDEFWTRANTGEVFLGAISPLGISLVVGGMDIYNHKGHVLREQNPSEYTPYFFHILPVTHRQICLNVIDTLLRSNEKEITPIQRAFEVALFGRPVLTEEMQRAGIKKHGYASVRRKYLGLLFIPMIALRMPKTIARLDKALSEYRLPLDQYTSARNTLEGIMQQMNLYSEMCGVHGMASFLSSYFNMMLITILAKGKKEWDPELYCDFATLLSSCSGVESADVPESLQELAKTIAKEYGNDFSSLDVSAAYDLLQKDAKESRKLFEKFLQHHGHRCVKEFDVYSKSWGMQPENVIPTLQNMVNAVSAYSDVAKKEVLSTEAILAKIKTPLSSLNKNILKFLIPRCRRYVCQREKTKSMVIKTVDWLRQSCYHLGQLMVEEGVLPESELVFFLTVEEISEILDSQKPGLVPRSIRRRRLHVQLNELKLPEIMKGIPKPIRTETEVPSFAASFSLKGTPVCQGRVKARAVVVHNLGEASEIKSGDILITHATDIGWSPYFPLVSGVVTVLGGLISHGAVIAREFGLPCVVGVENATIAFKTGDTVVLNGTEGTVTKILDEVE